MAQGRQRQILAPLPLGLICGALLGCGYASVGSSGPEALQPGRPAGFALSRAGGAVGTAVLMVSDRDGSRDTIRRTGFWITS
jgi:hypothetical protein